MRQIVCEKHGKVRPLHYEDAVRGVTQRHTRGITKGSYVCDVCDVYLPIGTSAVAITTMQKGQDIGDWESEYLTA